MDAKPSENESERLFLAVKLPSELQEIVAQACSKLSENFDFAKWTNPQDYHITLQFLGDTPKSKIPDLVKFLRQTAGQGRPFNLSLDKWDTFGLPASPRVLWIGVSGEIEALNQLAARVHSATFPLGFSGESRAYKPHLTVARKYRGKNSYDDKLLENLLKLDEDWNLKNYQRDWTIDSFVLYATRMYAIPMYEIIEKFTV
ncbi:RNA 2',3'-cyclic phosphodiesterase [Paenibacillus sp. FSL H7-0716]|uniref:RNA 2',3'-cyclic phosphodiesterase n=1 Tax=Paenibacillus odorifer TaxID=189426 RepID=A0AB36JDV7_9BACL|nr:RNA 2',3'-cyclic phosphodiesterase [Paenibacillus odorifer]OME15434.1 2'-5' RNA ligase [Paenibacillus odorifer]